MYKGGSILRKQALSVFIKMLNKKDIEPFREKFKIMDKDKTGFICA